MMIGIESWMFVVLGKSFAVSWIYTVLVGCLLISPGHMQRTLVVEVCELNDSVSVWPVVLRNDERTSYYVHYQCADGSWREALWFWANDDEPKSVLRQYASFQNEVSQ